MRPSDRIPPGKRAYRTPRLRMHGNLKAMTQTKNGRFSDGGTKPATRASGSTA